MNRIEEGRRLAGRAGRDSRADAPGRDSLALAALAAALWCCATAQAPRDSGAHEVVTVPAPSTTSAEARASSEEVLASGGELNLAQLPAATIERSASQLIAFGLAEVPGDSRLQAALALADANARAELLSAIRVGIASSLTVTSSASTSGGSNSSGSRELDSQAVDEKTAQVASGVLPALAPAQHGWRKLRRNGEVVLLVCARISASESALASTLAATLHDASDPALRAREILGQLGKGRALGAQ